MEPDTGAVELAADPGGTGEVQRVIDLSAASYHAAGHLAHTHDLPPPMSVYVPALRRAEIVLDGDGDTLDPEAVEELSRSGIEVCVLAPLGTIGTLRGNLRNRAAQIQGWWRDEAGAIKFDAPRVP